jgi:hypothetical protein
VVEFTCGNTFVLKPSERDPSPSLLLAALLQEAGLPDGAVAREYVHRVQVGMVGGAHPGAHDLPQLRRLEAQPVRRPPRRRPRGGALLHPAEGRTQRWLSGSGAGPEFVMPTMK